VSYGTSISFQYQLYVFFSLRFCYAGYVKHRARNAESESMSRFYSGAKVMTPRRQIFRQQALNLYVQGREKTMLPRSVAPPVFLFLWALLGLVLTAILFAWQAQVPISIQSAGVLTQNGQITPQPNGEVLALLFVPVTPSMQLQIGQTVSLQLPATGEPLTASIRSIAPDVVTPNAARQRYGLTGDLAFTITQPSIVVLANLPTPLPADVSAGRSVSAQVRVGSRSLLSLLPDLLRGIVGG